MPKMIVSIDDVVIKEVQLTKDRTTLGRRPYNDIVIDNLAVSGEHAVMLMNGSDVVIEDLNSTNGTYVNGRAVRKQQLQSGDGIEIGKYKIRFQNDAVASTIENPASPATRPLAPPSVTGPLAQIASHIGGTTLADLMPSNAQNAAIKVLSGVAAGREVALVKVVTTIGKPAVAVAAITRRHQGFVVHHVEGGGNPSLNGAPIGADPLPLKNGDVIELAGTRMQFVQS